MSNKNLDTILQNVKFLNATQEINLKDNLNGDGHEAN
jgi:hypothetical protein